MAPDEMGKSMADPWGFHRFLSRATMELYSVQIVLMVVGNVFIVVDGCLLLLNVNAIVNE